MGACTKKAISGFNAAGIYPYQPNKFSVEDFFPSEHFKTTEVVENHERNHDSSTNTETVNTNEVQQEEKNQNEEAVHVSADFLCPVPGPSGIKQKKSKPKQKSKILTDTPNKKDLTILEQKRIKRKTELDKKIKQALIQKHYVPMMN